MKKEQGQEVDVAGMRRFCLASSWKREPKLTKIVADSARARVGKNQCNIDEQRQFGTMCVLKRKARNRGKAWRL